MAQSRDLTEPGQAAPPPLQGQQARKTTTAFFVQHAQHTVDCSVLFSDDASWMMATGCTGAFMISVPFLGFHLFAPQAGLESEWTEPAYGT
jgi:hypothetical protein